jgi:peptidoglycan glycosyltransferase
MDSRPSFGLSELVNTDDWATAEGADRREGFSQRRLNRVIDGIYPPGSVFKAVTALAALDSGLFTRHWPILDYSAGEKGPKPPDGVEQLGIWHQMKFADGSIISCGNHPDLKEWRFDLESAVAWSCNVAFAEIALAIGAERFVDMAKRLGFEQEIELPGVGAFRSTLDNDTDKPLPERFLAKRESDLARTAFGQGQLLTSPLHMALIAAAIANGGKIMRPRLIQAWQFPDGIRPEGNARIHCDAALRQTTIDEMKQIMRASATYGWANYSALNSANAMPGVAGKTGSAEWSDDKDATHAWFIGYVPVEKPRVALAIIIERGGAGPIVATSVARNLFEAYATQHPAASFDHD